MKVVAIHSYKGGTGKTSVAANLAVTLALKGASVCLLDYDFRAPSLQVLFKPTSTSWVNDYLEGKCELNKTLTDLTDRYKLRGRLRVGLADPSSKAMREMMTKDRAWEMRALHKTLDAKTSLAEDFKIDYLIFDTSPGVHYSAVNALAASDYVILVMKADEFDLEGTRELVHGVYDTLGRKTGILLNKIPLNQELLQGGPEETTKYLERTLGLPSIGIIGCFCELMAMGGKSILALERPEHPFSRSIRDIAIRIEQL